MARSWVRLTRTYGEFLARVKSRHPPLAANRRQKIECREFCLSQVKSVSRTLRLRRTCGVTRNLGGWRAQIASKGQWYHLGTFGTPEEAARVYDAAAIKYHQSQTFWHVGDLEGARAWYSPDFDRDQILSAERADRANKARLDHVEGIRGHYVPTAAAPESIAGQPQLKMRPP